MEVLKTEDVAPQVLKSSLAVSTDGDLLHTEDSVGLASSKGTLLHIIPSPYENIQQC